LLLSLGVWQLHRADAKQALIDQYATGAAVTQLLRADNITTLPLLQSVTVQGRYDSAQQVLLDSMPSPQTMGGARPGYHVLTPLRLDGTDQLVLIDRGWVPLGTRREDLPNIQVSEQLRTVRGRLAEPPRAGIRLQGEPAAAIWPRVLNFPTMAELAALYDNATLPRIVLLDEDAADGFKRAWSLHYSVGEFGPQRHIAYAVQWFVMAATLVIIYLFMALRHRPTAA
jgi:surfeit locus 1 family protein